MLYPKGQVPVIKLLTLDRTVRNTRIVGPIPGPLSEFSYCNFFPLMKQILCIRGHLCSSLGSAITMAMDLNKYDFEQGTLLL